MPRLNTKRDVSRNFVHENGVKLSDLESIARDLRAQLAAVGKRVEDLNAEVDAAKRESDGFTALLYVARKHYGQACASAGKGRSRIEQTARASFLQAQEFGFKGGPADWEALLRLRIQPKRL